MENKIPVNQIVCGDCVEVLKGFPEGSVDCVVTDPPYARAKAIFNCLFDEFFNLNTPLN